MNEIKKIIFGSLALVCLQLLLAGCVGEVEGRGYYGGYHDRGPWYHDGPWFDGGPWYGGGAVIEVHPPRGDWDRHDRH